MISEDDVVELDRNLRIRVDSGVLALDVRHPKETSVEEEDGEVAHEVEGQKVEVEADHRAAAPVDVDLRVEGEGPGQEVQPAHHRARHVDQVARLSTRLFTVWKM